MFSPKRRSTNSFDLPSCRASMLIVFCRVFRASDRALATLFTTCFAPRMRPSTSCFLLVVLRSNGLTGFSATVLALATSVQAILLPSAALALHHACSASRSRSETRQTHVHGAITNSRVHELLFCRSLGLSFQLCLRLLGTSGRGRRELQGNGMMRDHYVE